MLLCTSSLGVCSCQFCLTSNRHATLSILLLKWMQSNCSKEIDICVRACVRVRVRVDVERKRERESKLLNKELELGCEQKDVHVTCPWSLSSWNTVTSTPKD